MSASAANNRDDFSAATRRTIAARSGFRCAVCRCQTEGPGLDPAKAVSIGEAAHITAAASGGPRYDATLTPERRSHADNGLWACKNHHAIIDRDDKRYSAPDLVRLKQRAEDLAQRLQGLEAAHGVEMAAAIVATRDASDRMIAQWRERYRYNQAGIIELDVREKPTTDGSGENWTVARVAEAVAQGHKLLLGGRAGAGKTITLLQVAEQLAAKAEGPVPLVFSVSGWLASQRDLATHVVGLLINHGVAAATANLLLTTGRLVILLNGWNEAPEAEQARASELLNDFLLSYGVPGVLLSTRATRRTPPMVGETVLELLPLTAAKREAAIRAANLTDPEALLRQIAQSQVLAEVTETPLFLGAAIRLARAGRPIPNSRAGLLESFLTDLQDTDQHAARLRALPCQDCHYQYQTDLAVEMTRAGLTVIPQARAVEIIAARSTALIAAGVIGQAGAAPAIAASLADHHALLYLPYGAPGYGFIHQQFQEWFSSRWLLAEVGRLAARPEGPSIFQLQRDYLNQPAWQEAVDFAIESLAAEGAMDFAAALVRWMMPVDLIRAAELVNLAGAAVWAAVRDELGRALRAWHRLGGLHEKCALTAMLATGQADFADLVWPNLEADDQAMFFMCRLHEPFRLAVLGTGATDRLARCQVGVETMFLREISREAAGDEIAYADARARQGPPSVRASALRLLLEQGRVARVIEILFAAEFGAWGEEIYVEVLPYVPAASLTPHVATIRAKFDATESAPLRGGIVDVLRRTAHADWTELAKEELNRALAALRAAPMVPPNPRQSALRTIAHHTHLLWRTQRDWMAAWLVETFGTELPEPLDHWLDKFPEDTMVAVATRVVAAPRTNYRASAPVQTLLASGSLRVARVFVDAYVADKLAGRDTMHLPHTEELRRQSPAVLQILVDAVLAKAATVTDFPSLEALVAAISPMSALDDSLGEQVTAAQRDSLRALVLRTSEAIPTDEEARSYRPTLAVLLGSLGAPDDVAVIVRWGNEETARIEAHRREVAAAAAARPPRRIQRYHTSWWNWYAGALALSRAAAAETEFLRWLDDPQLCTEGADGLVLLSLKDGSLPNRPETGRYRRAAPVPERALDDIRPAVRPRADAIVRAIERIEALPADDGQRRLLPALVAALGRLHDPRALDRLLALDGARHGWVIVRTLTVMQERGLVLPGRRVAAVLEPFIAEHEAVQHGSNDTWFGVQDALRLLLSSDAPAAATERMRRLPAARMNSYHARDIYGLLAKSPAPEAVDLLLEYSNTAPLRGAAYSEIFDALALNPDPRCHARLLELLHIPDDALPGGNRSDLYRCILQVAETDGAFRLQLTEAIRRGTVRWAQPPRFGPAIGSAELLESLLGGDDLRPIESELRQLVSELAETHEPAGGGSYYVFPADATPIKLRLARLLAAGGTKAEVGSRLLASLRLKRAERGQPPKEPLHPDITMLEGGTTSWPVRLA